MSARFSGRLTPRHYGTGAGALLLVVSSRLPLSRDGIGSALPSVEVAAMVGDTGNGALRVAGLILLCMLGSGLVLGPSVMFHGHVAAVAWWLLALFTLAGGTLLVAIQRGNSGGAVIGVFLAGLVVCGSGLFERLFWSPPS